MAKNVNYSIIAKRSMFDRVLNVLLHMTATKGQSIQEWTK